MQESREKWMELCARAADEQDPQKLAVLILGINFMLEAKERRLLKAAQPLPIGEDNPALQSKSLCQQCLLRNVYRREFQLLVRAHLCQQLQMQNYRL